MERKEELAQMVKAGFLREKKLKINKIKLHGKEVSVRKLPELLANRTIIYKGYNYIIVSKKKSK